ncbi:DUF342 domain-containing protein [Paenibacillus sp. GCM10027626]|uniref:DUF342 domain-containing protein n=1 Tax=Paenibacillus sp. GCM10027626 TaxID=3273411 RepID=UPI0036251A1B
MTTSGSLENSITIGLSQDKMAAYLQFHTRDDEFSCTLEQLEALIKLRGVLFGIDQELLQKIAENPKAYFQSQTKIAQGMLPRTGEDGSIKYVYNLHDKALRPQETEDGKVDFKEISQLKNVMRGQLIAEKVAAAEGQPGRLVTGEELPAKRGKEAYFKLGKNVVLNPEKTALYAAIDGMITLTDKSKINVFPIYEVNGDVDYKVGNIDFVGTVVVRGNVLNGFRIRASGDIRVIGGVEGAELTADGSVEVTGGILAANKGVVRAGKNVKSSFIQDGNVTASEDIIVTQSIMHSQVRAGRHVICNGAKGLIVGGTVQAGESVSARTVGNTMSTTTTIEVGVKPELRQELLELRQEIRTVSDNLEKTEKALVLLDQLAAAGQLTPDRLALRVKLTATKRQSAEELAVARERMLEIEKSLDRIDAAKVVVINTVYGGTKIMIGRNTRFVKDPTQRVVFHFAEGDIAMSAYY